MRALAFLEKEFKEEGPERKKRAVRGAAYIQPVVDNFRRTKAGGRLICQEIKRLLDTQAKMFPDRSFWNVDFSKVKFTDAKGDPSEIATDDLILKSPHFFSTYFHSIRRRQQYGFRVQNWLASVSWLVGIFFKVSSSSFDFLKRVKAVAQEARPLCQCEPIVFPTKAMKALVDDGSAKHLNALIQQIAACNLLHTIGMEEAPGEDSGGDAEPWRWKTPGHTANALPPTMNMLGLFLGLYGFMFRSSWTLAGWHRFGMIWSSFG